jgi:hypothetical protein
MNKPTIDVLKELTLYDEKQFTLQNYIIDEHNYRSSAAHLAP